ncbi:MAG: hypothetical protein K6E15_09345 [Prevotella sp.]|nr:hypothetical protein [Prevotella sp.]
MKRFGNNILWLTAAIACTACSSDLVREDIFPDKGSTLTVHAIKSQATADTRGLNPPDGSNNITAVWGESDRVSVLSATGAVVGIMTPTTTGTASTKLKATLNSRVNKGDQLKLVFPRTGRDYTGQVGTLEDIAANYDYASAQVEVNFTDGSFVSASDAHFVNQQAIVKFSLTDGSKPLKVSSLTIAADGLIQKDETKGSVTITPATATNEIYAALSGLEKKVVTLTATVGTRTWSYTTSEAKSFTNGNSYRVSCKLRKQALPYPQPLTLECAASDCRVSVTDYGDLEYYTSFKKQWLAYNGDDIDLSQGEWVSFRGTNSTNAETSSSSQYMHIQCNDKCYVYGNIMSLLNKENFATMTTLPYEHTFQNLFKDNTYITHAEGKDLVLPATSLKSYCYSEMFSGCSNFNYIKCLATEIPTTEESCTFDWLRGVAEEGTFVRADEFKDWTTGDNGIPTGWEIKTE